MPRRIGFLVLVVLTAFAARAGAADATGTWSGEVKLPSGQVLPFVARLQQDDSRITGRLDGIGGAPDVEILKGRIEGNIITFSGVRKIQDADVTFNYTGTLSGDTIDFVIVREDGRQAPLRTLTTRTN